MGRKLQIEEARAKIKSIGLELISDYKNVRTKSIFKCLCSKCHTNFHIKYGYGKNTKEQYLDFRSS